MADAEEEGSYELVMPFVCCTDHGGTYDAQSFVAGCQFQTMDTRLKNGEPTVNETIFPPMRDQADLLAMHHGYSVTFTEWDDDWLIAEFRSQVLP